MCGGQLTATWTSLAPASLSVLTRERHVVPRTMESSTIDDAFVLHQRLDEVQLHAHVEIADELRGLEKAAPDVVVADEGHFVGNAGFLGVAHAPRTRRCPARESPDRP